MMFLDQNYNKDLTLNKGDLILAEPFLSDVTFQRAVVLICEHQEEGTFGLVINKPTELRLHDILDFESNPHVIYSGGPVEQNSLHFIHTFPQIDGSIYLKNGLYWGGNFEQIKLYVENGVLNEYNCRFFIGYSGWSKHQLHIELKQNSWIIARYDLSKLYQYPAEKIWSHILREMGGKYKVISNFPTDPRLN